MTKLAPGPIEGRANRCSTNRCSGNRCSGRVFRHREGVVTGSPGVDLRLRGSQRSLIASPPARPQHTNYVAGIPFRPFDRAPRLDTSSVFPLVAGIVGTITPQNALGRALSIARTLTLSTARSSLRSDPTGSFCASSRASMSSVERRCRETGEPRPIDRGSLPWGAMGCERDAPPISWGSLVVEILVVVERAVLDLDTGPVDHDTATHLVKLRAVDE